jgi:hypothetical protein
MAGHKEQIIFFIKFCFNPEKTAFETHKKKKTLRDVSSEELKPVNSIHVSKVATLYFRILNIQVTYHQVGLIKRVCPVIYEYTQ